MPTSPATLHYFVRDGRAPLKPVEVPPSRAELLLLAVRELGEASLGLCRAELRLEAAGVGVSLAGLERLQAGLAAVEREVRGALDDELAADGQLESACCCTSPRASVRIWRFLAGRLSLQAGVDGWTWRDS